MSSILTIYAGKNETKEAKKGRRASSRERDERMEVCMMREPRWKKLRTGEREIRGTSERSYKKDRHTREPVSAAAVQASTSSLCAAHFSVSAGPAQKGRMGPRDRWGERAQLAATFAPRANPRCRSLRSSSQLSSFSLFCSTAAAAALICDLMQRWKRKKQKREKERERGERVGT